MFYNIDMMITDLKQQTARKADAALLGGKTENRADLERDVLAALSRLPKHEAWALLRCVRKGGRING